MRDRLIELITEYNEKWEHGEKDWKISLADYLLANGVIVPPCKVGDTVYSCICNAYQVRKIVIEKSSNCNTTYVLESGLNGQLIVDEKAFGKTVFLTREDAEKALKGEK